mgnify:CR=1 FL=1
MLEMGNAMRRSVRRSGSIWKDLQTMQGTGVINIVIGSVIITVGLAAGVMAIVSGAFLLKRKSDITF